MLRRTNLFRLAATRALFSEHPPGEHGHHSRFPDKEYPHQPHHLTERQESLPGPYRANPLVSKLMDQSLPMYDDVVTGMARVHWQEPCKTWHLFAADDVVVMEEHDKEEFNDRPYVTVNHLYEPPLGCEERPMRVEGQGNPGDTQIVTCFGNCAPHVAQGVYVMQFKGYTTTKCPMCQQSFYMHNRPWLIMHPDWTDEPASDEGPQYTFQEVEAEFDRDFHEFGVYLNIE